MLLPKIPDPRTPKDFRPISLCNVLFKLISKVIASKMKTFSKKKKKSKMKTMMPNLIGDNQAAFVAERMMHDKAIVASELIHCMKNKRSGRHGLMEVKLGMV